jgi:hypothetical protein
MYVCIYVFRDSIGVLLEIRVLLEIICIDMGIHGTSRSIPSLEFQGNILTAHVVLLLQSYLV